MPKTPPATELREIAAQLQAMIDGGDFALCFAHVRADMALLPDRLAELANEIEAPLDALEDVMRSTGEQLHDAFGNAEQVLVKAGRGSKTDA